MGILQEGTAILDVAKVVTNSEYESRGITKGLILRPLCRYLFHVFSLGNQALSHNRTQLNDALIEFY